MITNFEVKCFQSIEHADLALGKFTVIVGQTNSGKSALVRALKTLITNATGNSFVTTGKKASCLVMTLDKGHIVQLDRGQGVSEYRLSAPGSMVETYTKSGTKVPDAVASTLNFPIDSDGNLLSVAGQFDKPFLLDSPATAVAKILGDLTNVTLIYEAQREANRLRLSSNSVLKVRQTDLDGLRVKAASFAGLKPKLDLITQLQLDAEQLDADAALLERAAAAFEKWNAASQVVDDLTEKSVTLPDIEIFDKLEKAARVLAQADRLVQDISQSALAITGHEEAIAQCREQADVSLRQEQELLASLGTCPLCGANTKEPHGH